MHNETCSSLLRAPQSDIHQKGLYDQLVGLNASRTMIIQNVHLDTLMPLGSSPIMNQEL